LVIALLLGAVVPSFGSGAPPQVPPGTVLAGAKELTGLRTANSRTFANPDGTRAVEVHPEPINYPTAGGKWAPIDDSLIEDGTSGYRNKANSIQMRVPKTLNAPVRLDDGDASMSFDLVGVAPSLAAIDGNTARYADVFPDVDVEYTMLSGSLKEDVVLKSSEAQSSFSYRLKLSNGLSARLTAQQAVDVADAAGKVRFTLAPPVLEDSSGIPEGLAGPVKATLVPEAGGFTLTYAADKDWLAAPERVFPVRLDPTVLYNSYYSYVVQGAGSPTTWTATSPTPRRPRAAAPTPRTRWASTAPTSTAALRSSRSQAVAAATRSSRPTPRSSTAGS
jgi:hypothetical protein